MGLITDSSIARASTSVGADVDVEDPLPKNVLKSTIVPLWGDISPGAHDIHVIFLKTNFEK